MTTDGNIVRELSGRECGRIVMPADGEEPVVAFEDAAKNFLQIDLFQIVFDGSRRSFFAGMLN
jgi:hypothetical protein